MKRVPFTNTDLQVSELCLGTSQFGSGLNKEKCFALMDTYSEAGGNFLDTALVYGDWGDEPASSEKMIGRWMKERGNRQSLILATKGCHPKLETMEVPRIGTEYLRADVEASLQNLSTDVIDLYFLHRDNPEVSMAEIMEGLEEQVKKGNLRYYGCSNWKLSRIKEAADYAKEHGFRGFVCNQAEFSLADINKTADDMVILEDDLYQYHKENQLSAMAYHSQAGGYFTKRLQNREISAGKKERYDGPGNDAIFYKLQAYEKEGYSANDFLLHYIRKLAFPTIPICGFSTREQLINSLAGINKNLPEELLAELITLKKRQVYGR